MAGTATPIFPQTLKTYGVLIAPADTTTLKTLATGGTNGTKIESIMVTSTDTAIASLCLWVTISAVNYLIGTVNVPASAGFTSAIPSVDVLRSAQLPGLALDPNGNRYLYLASGLVLSVSVLATVTAAKQIAVTASGGDF